MQPAGGADYSRLREGAVAIRLHGEPVELAALDDVVASKEAAGRPKDRQALPVLRELRHRLDIAESARKPTDPGAPGEASHRAS